MVIDKQILHVRFFRSFSLLLIVALLALGSACSPNPVYVAFEKAKEENTMAAYEQFLRKYGNTEYAPEAKELMELPYYQSLSAKPESGGGDIYYQMSNFDTYLQTYPTGKYVEDVRRLREKFWFENATQQNTVKAFKGYLLEYPNGHYVSEAKRLQEKIWFENGRDGESVQTLEAYLSEYPAGLYSKEAKALREKIWFLEAKKLNTYESYAKFLIEFPKSDYAEQIEQQIEDLDYEVATTKNTLQIYDLYLLKYPEGRYAEKIQAYRDKVWAAKSWDAIPTFKGSENEAWEFTVKIDNYFQYEWFIRNFPDSPYVKEAKERSTERLRNHDKLKR